MRVSAWVENEYEGQTLDFEFCKYSSFTKSQPLAPCTLRAHKIARYISHNVILCRIWSSDTSTQAQGVISICWGCGDNKRKRERCQMRCRTKTYTTKTIYIPRTTVIFVSLPSTDTIFVCFLWNIVSPSKISTPTARNIFTTCWTEDPLTAIWSPCAIWIN